MEGVSGMIDAGLIGFDSGSRKLSVFQFQMELLISPQMNYRSPKNERRLVFAHRISEPSGLRWFA